MQIKKTENVMTKINYIKSKGTEELKGFYDTADYRFWKDFHIESRKRYKNSPQARMNNKGVAEGSHIIIAIPQQYELTPELVELVCKHFKNHYGVECCGAAHFVAGNKHIHLVIADRLRLAEPIIVEEKRAERNYYYDATGKKCKKAEAVKVLPKGTVTREGYTQNFSSKINFIGKDFIESYTQSLKEEVLPAMKMTDVERSFFYQKAGRKPSDVVQHKNRLTKMLNIYFENVECEYGLLNNGYFDLTPKKYFKNKYHIKSDRYILNSEIDKIERAFEKFKLEYPLSIKIENKEDISKKEKTTHIEPSEPLKNDFELFEDYSTIKDIKEPKHDFNDLSEDELREEYIEVKTNLYQTETEQSNDTSLIQQLIDLIEEIISVLKEKFGYNDTGIAMLDEKVEQELGIEDDFGH